MNDIFKNTIKREAKWTQWVWDFTMVLSQLFAVSTWIEAKWNWNQYGFHIGHFNLNEISNRHEILMWTKFTQSEMNVHVRLKLIAGVISLRSFWQKRNFISGDTISCRHYPKWNACICSCEQNLFSRRFEIGNRHDFISPRM